MLDFFAVISKGGLVLWYFQDVAQKLTTSIDAINALIKDVILQERGGLNIYNYENLSLKVKMDNEFDLIYLVIYQKILQLSYVDKFLTDAHREFRDKYKKQLQAGLHYQAFDFSVEYSKVLKIAEHQSKIEKLVVRAPRTYDESEKSKKTVESMVEKRSGENKSKKSKKKEEKTEVYTKQQIEELLFDEPKINDYVDDDETQPKIEETNGQSEEVSYSRDEVQQRLRDLQKKRSKANKTKSPGKPVKKSKEARVWDLTGRDTGSLDYSRKDGQTNGIDYEDEDDEVPPKLVRPDFLPDPSKVGTLGGNLKGLDDASEKDKKASSSGVFSLFKSLVGGKVLTTEDMKNVLNKLRDHLIAKNVASEIAYKLCQSVESKLEGKHLGTFEGVTSIVRSTLTDALVQLLTPRRRIDILRDIAEAKEDGRPYVMTFCGVNGVGKSTNLAKISFWLIENNLRVLIAACDTFRAGAVEQLRTHAKHLNALHPRTDHKLVTLFEQGYGKDAADIARYAVEFAGKNDYDVVLIDTAGRMQDNEPLMRALAKLIHINKPDLTLFVGEALVGNEAVDQLLKFDGALDKFSSSNQKMIDGIVLTKFDTIDDKVGAAVSMAYITGQPIVFVGTGQTYTDLRSLDPKAVVSALMK